MRFDELTRSAAALAGLCAIAIAGLTASCFSERTTTPAANSCGATTGVCEVEIQNFAFVPAQVRITAGTAVRWTNRDQVGHTSTSDGAGWDSPLLSQGQTFSRTFTAAGQFPYHCEPHPNMQGTVIVE